MLKLLSPLPKGEGPQGQGDLASLRAQRGNLSENWYGIELLCFPLLLSYSVFVPCLFFLFKLKHPATVLHLQSEPGQI